jgi:hypothetical protein
VGADLGLESVVLLARAVASSTNGSGSVVDQRERGGHNDTADTAAEEVVRVVAGPVGGKLALVMQGERKRLSHDAASWRGCARAHRGAPRPDTAPRPLHAKTAWVKHPWLQLLLRK